MADPVPEYLSCFKQKKKKKKPETHLNTYNMEEKIIEFKVLTKTKPDHMEEPNWQHF